MEPQCFSSCVQHDLPCSKGPLLASCIIPLEILKVPKSVAFDQVVRAKKTIHIANYTQEELIACWYTNHEQREMKRKARHIAKNIARADRATPDDRDEDEECTLGLEILADSGCSIRSMNRSRHIAAVLEEQHLQYIEGSDDPDYIAEICVVASHASNLHAIQVAQSLLLEVR